MQRGTITLRRGKWTVFYWDIRMVNGLRQRVRTSRLLTERSKEYPTKASVRYLADKVLDSINSKSLQPESSLFLADLIENYYLPWTKSELKPSTYRGYNECIYLPHLRDRLNEAPMRVRDFRTVHGQRLLRSIDGVSHTTLLHIKSFLSGVFKFAKREGILDGVNPMTDVSVKGRPSKFRGVAYSLEEVFRMLEDVESAGGENPTRDYLDAHEVITLLSLTGLRSGECRGLKWSDWNEKERTLSISRSVWRTHEGTPKTIASEDKIPVIPLLAEMLERRRVRLSPRPDSYIFAGIKGAPLNLHNLENRIIKTALEKGRQNNMAEIGIEWKGYHGFRRGLATNLLSLGVEPIIAAAIMRHSDVRTTLENYNTQHESAKAAAMAKLEASIRNMPTGLVSPEERESGSQHGSHGKEK